MSCSPINFDQSSIDWEKGGGLIPAIIQDEDTLCVLMLGYMTPEALAQTLSTSKVTFFSRTKNRLWTKGETSGNFLFASRIFKDCDSDALLVFVKPEGPTCHTGNASCFDGAPDTSGPLDVLTSLERVIHARAKEALPNKSYTAALLAQGPARIAQKVGEEGVEVALAGALGTADLNDEAADLLYHLLVLLGARGSSLKAVMSILSERTSSS